jgi:hypothetical protein
MHLLDVADLHLHLCQSIVNKIAEKLAQRQAGEGQDHVTGRILGMAELQSLGKENMVPESFWTEAKPKRDDLFCIMVSEDNRLYDTRKEELKRATWIVHFWIYGCTQGSLVDSPQHCLFP